MATAINSRSLNDLDPEVKILAERFIAECKKQGIQILITSTYRNFASQAALYAQGRTTPGKKVTNAKPGQSYHNWRRSFDCVPIVNGKPVWSTTGEAGKLWAKVGAIGKSVGLDWAGDWKTFKEMAHFQKLPEGVSSWKQLLARYPNGLPEKRELFEDDDEVIVSELP